MKRRVRIAIIGGGFAGLHLVKRLMKDDRFTITLIDKNNYHYFPPLLYQVGMAFIEVSNITHPFRRLFQNQANTRFHLGAALKVDTSSSTVFTECGKISYDFLVIATGTQTNYFGMEHVRVNSWPLKTVPDALNLRNKLLYNIERAVQCAGEEERRSLLTVVIAGGGPTGVEVAGMLAESVHKIGPREYPEIARGTFRIFLVQSGDALLNGMSKKAQAEALTVLRRLGVHVLLNTRVQNYIDHKVLLSNGESIGSHALLWTSGVTGSLVDGFVSSSTGHGNRLIVDQFNKVKDTLNVFAIGDISLCREDPRYPEGHPQLAQVAIQQGKLLAENLRRHAENQEMRPFVYKDKGTMAIISKYKAVADLPRLSMTGFPAWFTWLFIHLIPIAGFRNKLDLMLNWAYSFLTDNPTLRLIIRREPPEVEREGIGLKE